MREREREREKEGERERHGKEGGNENVLPNLIMYQEGSG